MRISIIRLLLSHCNLGNWILFLSPFEGVNYLCNEMKRSKLSFLFHELKNTLFYGDIVTPFCLHKCWFSLMILVKKNRFNSKKVGDFR